MAKKLGAKARCTGRGKESPDTSPEAILFALAKREQEKLDEELKPVGHRPGPFRAQNLARLAKYEGWKDADTLAQCVENLTADGLIEKDPNRVGTKATKDSFFRLRPEGFERALARARDEGHDPLQSFDRDTTFDENGIGQVEIELLGERIVVGCAEGEEGHALLYAHYLEVDAGENLKAVAGLDNRRAIIMAALWGRERIDELEDQLRLLQPYPAEPVELDHGSADYRSAIVAVDRLIALVQQSNEYREAEPDDQERRLAELEAGRRLLGSRWLSPVALKAALIGTIAYLATKFIDAPIDRGSGNRGVGSVEAAAATLTGVWVDVSWKGPNPRMRGPGYLTRRLGVSDDTSGNPQGRSSWRACPLGFLYKS